jgi:hypothetical protein
VHPDGVATREQRNLRAILEEEISELPPEIKRLYEQYAVAPFHQPCIRFGDSPIEQVFVVAKNSDLALLR